MFQYSYTDFLSASILHPFYKDLVCSDFTFSPLPQTASILDALGLRFKMIGGKLMLYQQLDADGQPFQSVDAVTDLFFTVSVKTDLLNITETTGPAKYWFSNLREDGSYTNNLTHQPAVTADEALAEIYGQQIVLNFPQGKITAVVVKQLKAGTGWTEIKRLAINDKSSSVSFSIAAPGLYELEKQLAAGGIEVVRMVVSDELKAARDLWSVIHLQIKPADKHLDLTISFNARSSVWQYYLVESESRAGGALTAAKLAMTYVTRPESRYPAAVTLAIKDPATYPDRVKQYVSAIRSSGRVKEVYLFESAAPLTLFDGVQPELKISYANQDIASKVTIPDRSMNQTSIIYKL